MKTIITNRKFETSDRLKAIIERKLSKLDRFFPVEETANVTLSTRKQLARVEITIFFRGTIFRAEVESKDVIIALYEAVDTLERQIRKNKTKLEKKIRDFKIQNPEGAEPLDELEEDTIGITKKKNFVLTEMTPEDAVLQMNLLAHNFYMFKNSEDGKISVVYVRNDGEYGIISAE